MRLISSPWPVLVVLLIWLLFFVPGLISKPDTFVNVITVVGTVGAFMLYWFIYGDVIIKKFRL